MTLVPHELTKFRAEDFTYKDVQFLPETQGIYGIIDELLGLEYLGISKNLKNRFTNSNTGLFDHHYYHLKSSPTPLSFKVITNSFWFVRPFPF